MAISLTWPLTSDGAGAVTYTANDWRTLLSNLFGEGILGAGSFVVSERAAGASMKLDIAAGVAVLTGDDAAGQGNYLIEASETLEAVTIPTADGSNPRIDLVGIQLNDPSEGGAAGRNSVFAVVQGTAAASPSAPAAPDSFLTLASVLVPTGATSIEDADITDLRTEARLVHEVVNTAALVDEAVTAAKLDSDLIESAWTNATYASGWTVPDGSRQRLQYKKIGNIVHVYGGGKRTGPLDNSVMATLPAGFRPAAGFRIPVYNSTIDGGDRAQIGSDGAIVCYVVDTGEEVSFAASFAVA